MLEVSKLVITFVEVALPAICRYGAGLSGRTKTDCGVSSFAKRDSRSIDFGMHDGCLLFASPPPFSSPTLSFLPQAKFDTIAARLEEDRRRDAMETVENQVPGIM